MALQSKQYKGYIMLFGFFRIRRNLAYANETGGPPELDNLQYINKLEPWMRKWCTIKWIETDYSTDKELAWF